MDYGTIVDRVRDYLDRDDLGTSISAPLSGSRIGKWVNDTRKYIAGTYDFNYLYVEATIMTSAGSAIYSLPEDYLGHLTMFCQSLKLARVGAREFDELTGIDTTPSDNTPYLTTRNVSPSGAPEYYIDRGMSFELYPAPDSAYLVTLKYYAQPADFGITTDEDYISRFHFEVIIFGAALRGALFLDDEQKITNYTQAFKIMLGEMLSKEKEKQKMDNKFRVKSWKDFDLESFKRMLKIDNNQD